MENKKSISKGELNSAKEFNYHMQSALKALSEIKEVMKDVEINAKEDLICCGTCYWMNDGECDHDGDCIDFMAHEPLRNNLNG